jgi:DNA-binding CsgD family transcriptional regulator
MLEAVGLATTEREVYLALLDDAPATIAQLRARVRAARLPAALATLEAHGLISRLAGRPVRYQPARPDLALEVLVRAQEQQLQQVRVFATNLTERFQAGRGDPSPGEIVEVVSTREATMQRWAQLQKSARREVRAFDRPPYAGGGLSNDTELEMLGTGVGYRCVYDRSGLELPGRIDGIRGFIAAGEQARVTSDVPVKMFLADDAIGLISLDRPASTDSALVIHSSSLLDTLIALFEAVWANAVPLPFHNDHAAATPAHGRQTLLGLLAAGLTDAAIARQLGCHPRTAQRRVHELMTELGAQTRFQAGLQAARGGWS